MIVHNRLQNRYIRLMSFSVIVVMLIIIHPFYNFSACFAVGFLAGILYGEEEVPVGWWISGSIITGSAAAFLCGIPEETFDNRITRILIVATVSLLLSFFGHAIGKPLIRIIRKGVHLRSLIREIDAEYPIYFKQDELSQMLDDD